MKKQLAFVTKELLEKGYITRNYCLSQFISRLGAIIPKIRTLHPDWVIEAEYTDDKDYKYTLVSRARRIVDWDLSTGVAKPIYG